METATVAGIVYQWRHFVDWTDFYSRTGDLNRGPIGDGKQCNRMSSEEEYNYMLRSINTSKAAEFKGYIRDLDDATRALGYVEKVPDAIAGEEKREFRRRIEVTKQKISVMP
jgi:hypothetical protein